MNLFNNNGLTFVSFESYQFISSVMKYILTFVFSLQLLLLNAQSPSDSTFIGEFGKVKVSFIQNEQGKVMQLHFKNEEDPAYGEYGIFRLYSKNVFECFVSSSQKAIELCENEATETWYCGMVGIQIWSTRPTVTLSQEVGNGLIALLLTKDELSELVLGIKDEGKKYD